MRCSDVKLLTFQKTIAPTGALGVGIVRRLLYDWRSAMTTRRAWCAFTLLGALVPPLAPDEQGVVLDLDGDVLLDVDTRQLQPDDRVLTVTGDLGPGGELGRRGERPPHDRVELGEGVTPCPQGKSAHYHAPRCSGPVPPGLAYRAT